MTWDTEVRELVVGDRVRVTDRALHGAGLTGVVSHLTKNGGPSFILEARVVFDDGFVFGHDYRWYAVANLEAL